MLQTQALTMSGNSLRLPTRLTAIRIDPRVHASRMFDLNEKEKGSSIQIKQSFIECECDADKHTQRNINSSLAML